MTNRPAFYFFSFSVILILLALSCRKEKDKKPIACIPDELEEGIIAFYPFSGGSLNDYSGANHPLSNENGALRTADRSGNPECAYLFNNLPKGGQFLFRENANFLNDLPAFSISLWYEALDTSRKGGDFETLIGRDSVKSCPDRTGQWSLGLYDCRSAVFGRTNSVWEQNPYSSCQEGINARTNGWHHLVATFNQNGIEMAIYRDGILQEKSNEHGDCSNGIPPIQDIGTLLIGRNFSGKLDDIIIFNRTLSGQEVTKLFQLSPCCE